MFAVYDATGCSNDQAEAAAKGESRVRPRKVYNTTSCLSSLSDAGKFEASQRESKKLAP